MNEGKQELVAFRANAQFTTNTRYESEGEVTITIPVEMALFVTGVLWAMYTYYTPPGGKRIDVYNAILGPLWGSGCVVPQDVRDRLGLPYFETGRKIGLAAKEVAEEYIR